MANLYENANTSNYYHTSQEPDEISLFLQQILLRSSSSSSRSFLRQQPLFPAEQHAAEVLGQISAAESSSELNSCSGCGFAAAAAANLSPSSAGNLDTETDDCDYESEVLFEKFLCFGYTLYILITSSPYCMTERIYDFPVLVVFSGCMSPLVCFCV